MMGDDSMTRLIFARAMAVLFIICAMIMGMYLHFSGNNPNALTSRAIMVFAYRR